MNIDFSFTNPYLLAIFSSFIGALLTFTIEKIIYWQRDNSNRRSQLNILNKYFLCIKDTIIDIRDGNNDLIHSYINSDIVVTLLRGEYLSPAKDEDLIVLLHEWIQVTELINRAFHIIDIKSGGFTTGQIESANTTRSNLKNAVPEFLLLINSCTDKLKIRL